MLQSLLPVVRPGWRWLAVVVLLAIASGCTPGQLELVRPRISVTTEEWVFRGRPGRKITTDHFEIYSTLFDHELEAALPEFLEAAYRRYEATLAPVQQTEVPLKTYIFGTRREWEHYTRLRSPERVPVYAKIRCGGYTKGNTSAQFYTSRSATLATLAHEGWHQYAGSRFPSRLPPWLDEGLACYHEAYHYAKDRPVFTPRHNTFRINSLREAIQRDQLFALRQIIATDAGQVILHHRSRRTQIYYAQAWALVTFLRHGQLGRHGGAFNHMLRDVANGTLTARARAARLTSADPLNTSYGEAVFVAYFGSDLDKWQKQYHDYLVRLAGF